MLLSTIGASLLEIYQQERELQELVQENKGIFNAASSFNKLLNTKVLKNEPSFNGVFSRSNLPKAINDGAYVINLDEYADVSTHWVALFCNRNEIVYFDSFGIEHVPEEIKEVVGNKNIIANIFRVQANNSVMCGYFCIGFLDFMLAA